MSTQTDFTRQATAQALTQSFPGTRASFAEFLAETATAFAERLMAAARMRRDRKLLSEMDEYRLHDIGIARSEIERAVRYGRS
jgi:uncharacterized protein YjiS (DUF1127 family)